MLYAVEVKTAQVKRLGHPSNLYIVQGEDFAYETSDRTAGVQCEITTREGASKNRIGYLQKSAYPVDGLDPRPNHEHQWERVGNRWQRIA